MRKRGQREIQEDGKTSEERRKGARKNEKEEYAMKVERKQGAKGMKKRLKEKVWA